MVGKRKAKGSLAIPEIPEIKSNIPDGFYRSVFRVPGSMATEVCLKLVNGHITEVCSSNHDLFVVVMGKMIRSVQKEYVDDHKAI